MEIKVYKIDSRAVVPRKIEQGDWVDLHTIALEIESGLIKSFHKVPAGYDDWSIMVRGGDVVTMRTGLAMKLPEGYEGIIAPRSSTFKKTGLLQTNSIGVIDNSYCGEGDEWMIKFYATRDEVITIPDRFAQFRIQKSMPSVEITVVDSLEDSNRGGFGSTDEIDKVCQHYGFDAKELREDMEEFINSKPMDGKRAGDALRQTIRTLELTPEERDKLENSTGAGGLDVNAIIEALDRLDKESKWSPEPTWTTCDCKDLWQTAPIEERDIKLAGIENIRVSVVSEDDEVMWSVSRDLVQEGAE